MNLNKTFKHSQKIIFIDIGSTPPSAFPYVRIKICQLSESKPSASSPLLQLLLICFLFSAFREENTKIGKQLSDSLFQFNCSCDPEIFTCFLLRHQFEINKQQQKARSLTSCVHPAVSISFASEAQKILSYNFAVCLLQTLLTL